jgi:hypothetical protein
LAIAGPGDWPQAIANQAEEDHQRELRHQSEEGEEGSRRVAGCSFSFILSVDDAAYVKAKQHFRDPKEADRV